MGKQESRVEVPGGYLAVVDHGGTGHDVLLLHSVCHACVVWDDVAAALIPHAHVVAVDLRGHGQSSADVTDVAQISDDIAELITSLGLHRPVLVGHDVAGGFAAAVAVAHPERVGGLVVVDSPVVETQAAVRDIVEAVGADVIVDMLVERFGLGRTGPDAASMEEFVSEYSTTTRADWLTAAPDEASARVLVLRSMTIAPDGSWVRRPLPSTVRALTKDPHGSRFQPGRELLAEIEVPTTVVTLSQGRNGSGGEAMVEFAARRPGFNLVRLDGSPQILYVDPHAVVREVRDVIAAAADAPNSTPE